MKAAWNGKTLAEGDDTIMIEGNHYFPIDSVNKVYLEESNTHTTCPWKGLASYYHIKVNDEINEDAAWYYPNPSDAALPIKNHIDFWKGVEVVDE